MWTYGELLQLGKTRGEIASDVRAGKIHRLFHGVYTTTAKPTAQTAWEALQKVRPDAVLDGRSAVEVHQGKQPSLPLHARVPTPNLRRGAAGIVRLRRCRRAGWEKLAGFRVVPLADAVATCLQDGSVPESDLRGLVEREYISERGMRRQASELKELKTLKKGQVKEFLDACISGTDSGLERRFVAALRKAGFKTRQNYVVAGYRWDTVIKSLRVVIDVDSRKYHGSENRNFIIDRWKTNDAQAEGWLALRITDDCANYAIPQIVGWLRRIENFRKQHPRGALQGRSMGPVWHWHNALMGAF